MTNILIGLAVLFLIALAVFIYKKVKPRCSASLGNCPQHGFHSGSETYTSKDGKMTAVVRADSAHQRVSVTINVTGHNFKSFFSRATGVETRVLRLLSASRAHFGRARTLHKGSKEMVGVLTEKDQGTSISLLRSFVETYQLGSQPEPAPANFRQRRNNLCIVRIARI